MFGVDGGRVDAFYSTVFNLEMALAQDTGNGERHCRGFISAQRTMYSGCHGFCLCRVDINDVGVCRSALPVSTQP